MKETVDQLEEQIDQKVGEALREAALFTAAKTARRSAKKGPCLPEWALAVFDLAMTVEALAMAYAMASAKTEQTGQAEFRGWLEKVLLDHIDIVCKSPRPWALAIREMRTLADGDSAWCCSEPMIWESHQPAEATDPACEETAATESEGEPTDSQDGGATTHVCAKQSLQTVWKKMSAWAGRLTILTSDHALAGASKPDVPSSNQMYNAFLDRLEPELKIRLRAKSDGLAEASPDTPGEVILARLKDKASERLRQLEARGCPWSTVHVLTRSKLGKPMRYARTWIPDWDGDRALGDAEAVS